MSAPKAKTLVAAVGIAAAAGFAQQASALPPEAHNSHPAYNAAAFPGPTLDLWVSGASAQDVALEKLFSLLCDTGTLDIYHQTDIKTNHRVLFCRLSPTNVPGLSATTKVALHKTSVGGSGNGVGPVATATPLSFMNLNGINTVGSAPGTNCGTNTSVPASGAFAAHNVHDNCPTLTQSEAPDAGISDVEPALFFLGAGGVSPADQAKLDVRSQNAVIFAPLATKGLRDALQGAQFPASSVCNPGNASYAANAESEACMPSLTRSQLAGLYSGNIATWDVIHGLNNPSGNNNVYLARRVNTSGTQASFNAYFLDFGAATSCGGKTGMPPANDGGTCGAGTVFEGSGTGNVLACLNTHHGAGRWAIGISSTESMEKPTDNWRYLKVNGVAPTLLNTQQSKYDFFMEQSIQWRNASTPNPLTGDKLAVMQKVQTDAGNPTILADVDSTLVHSWGPAGVMALLTNGFSPTYPLNTANASANPVLTSTKSASGAPDNCNDPINVLQAP